MNRIYSELYVHLVIVTKYRELLILDELKMDLYHYILNILKEMNVHSLAINGLQDHIHILISIRPNQSISNIIKSVKGASSYWVNHQVGNFNFLKWQRGFGAFTVSKKDLTRVIKYILNQESHHLTKGRSKTRFLL